MKSYTFTGVLAALASVVAGTEVPKPEPTWDLAAWRAQARTHNKTAKLPLDYSAKVIAAGDWETYDVNWSGACFFQDPSSSGPMTAVSAIYNVPTPTPTPGGSGGTNAAWVGIDGATCQSGLLQAGVAFVLNSGKPQYWAWIEWFPAPPITFQGFTINPGDEVYVYVQASSPSTGNAQIHNFNSGQTTSTTISAPNPTATLCGTDAEWIVEENAVENFHSVNFIYAAAQDLQGNTYNPTQATIVDVEQNNVIYTHTTTNVQDVAVHYVGPGS